MRTLSPQGVRAYYDRLGRGLDSQAFYEDPALSDLVRHGDFTHAHRVLEFGCGTGRLAARLFAESLPADARYDGIDISPRMIAICAERLGPWQDRVTLHRADGAPRLPAEDHSVDRVIATYVLDLLPERDADTLLREAHRVLKPGGRLCLASLTHGVSGLARCLSHIWMALFRLHPVLTGGCRPIHLDPLLAAKSWQIAHRRTICRFGLCSEIVIASPL